VIFVQQASGAIMSAGSEGVEVDDVVGSWFQRGGLIHRLMRSMPIAEARPHQGRDQTPPDGDPAEIIPIQGRIRRRQVPGTTIHEYHRAA